MNKAVHALVFVILALAGTALFFEFKISDKKDYLKDRNRLLEDYLVQISRTIEKADAPKAAQAPKIEKDVSPIEAKEVDSPDMENVLEDYRAELEEANLETFKWGDAQRMQLRALYQLDAMGERIPDVTNPGDYMKKGKGTAAELLDELFNRAKAQQAVLNTTRAELAKARQALEELAADYNKIKPPARADKIAIEELKGKVEELETAKKAAEEQTQKVKAQVDDLNSEITSLKDELTTAKDDTEAVKEDLEKANKQVEQFKKLLLQTNQSVAANQANNNAGANNNTAISAGKKGAIRRYDKTYQFAVVELDESAKAEVANRSGAMLGVMRGDKYIGKLMIKQAISNSNFIIAEVISDWMQVEEFLPGDTVVGE